MRHHYRFRDYVCQESGSRGRSRPEELTYRASLEKPIIGSETIKRGSRIQPVLIYQIQGDNMFLRKSLPIFFLSIAMASACFAMRPQDDQSAKQDIKDAGHSTKDAAKDTGRATKKTAKKTGHTVKKDSKKIIHKSAQKTGEGAQKVEDKTEPNK